MGDTAQSGSQAKGRAGMVEEAGTGSEGRNEGFPGGQRPARDGRLGRRAREPVNGQPSYQNLRQVYRAE